MGRNVIVGVRGIQRKGRRRERCRGKRGRRPVEVGEGLLFLHAGTLGVGTFFTLHNG